MASAGCNQFCEKALYFGQNDVDSLFVFKNEVELLKKYYLLREEGGSVAKVFAIVNFKLLNIEKISHVVILVQSKHQRASVMLARPVINILKYLRY